MDGKGKEEVSGADLTDMVCVLSDVRIPDYVVSQIDDTRALDGRQTAEWEGNRGSSSYHSNSGLSMVLQDTRITG